MKVKLLDAAKDDLISAISFYEKQQTGLGRRFNRLVMAELKSLPSSAGTHLQVSGYFRLLINKFPFAVYYKFNQEAIFIYAILDCRQKPSTNLSRLSSV